MADPIYLTNFAFTMIILILGCVIYLRKKDMLPLLVGIAFGLFGLTHLITLLELTADLEIPVIIMRAAAYILVIFALVMYLRQLRISKQTSPEISSQG